MTHETAKARMNQPLFRSKAYVTSIAVTAKRPNQVRAFIPESIKRLFLCASNLISEPALVEYFLQNAK